MTTSRRERALSPISTLPRVLRLLCACLVLCELVASNRARADDPQFAVGLNLGGLWGESKTGVQAYDDGDPNDKLYFKPHTPCHWLLSAQLGLMGARARGGLRAGFDRCRTGQDDWTYDRTHVRVGPYLGPVLWRGSVREIPVTLYAEAAFYFDKYLSDGGGGALNLTPSLGLGADAALWRGLRVGLYGGFGYSFYVEGLDGGVDGKALSLFEGDVRLTLLYAFGANAGGAP